MLLEFTSLKITVLKVDAWRLGNAKERLGLDLSVYLREDLCKSQQASKQQQDDVMAGFPALGVKVSWQGDPNQQN